MDTEPKAPSSYVTTITTAVDSDHQSSSESMFVLRVIHSEMERKLEELRDVRKAFVYLTTDWTDEKNLATAKVNQHCYAVQQAWLQAGDRLENAVERLEKEIGTLRQELGNVLVALYGHR
ncbi:hypothetical protein BGX29_010963 [Mortierella sp. GBA35]|nr:hypothetical protein BGX29_010963 [Mortierella sp. GBA35]